VPIEKATDVYLIAEVDVAQEAVRDPTAFAGDCDAKRMLFWHELESGMTLLVLQLRIFPVELNDQGL
jgi:hypothetical protein